MTENLTHQILARAHQLDGPKLDAMAQQSGTDNWTALTKGLEFSGYDSGGGCMLLVADLPMGHALQLTDGETDVPKTVEEFCVGIVDDDGQALLTVFSAS